MAYTKEFSAATGDQKSGKNRNGRKMSGQGPDDLFTRITLNILAEEKEYKFEISDFLDPEGTGDEDFEVDCGQGRDSRTGSDTIVPGSIVQSEEESSGSKKRSGQTYTERYNAMNAVTDLAEKNNPLSGFRKSSDYGVREHPVNGQKRDHKGIDIAAPTGTDVKAATDAKVAYSGWAQGYGNIVILSHGSGVYSLYAHLSKSDVQTGGMVRAGEKFADVGNTGVGTGAHLHYELMVRQDKAVTNVNPSKFSLADLADPTMREHAVADAARTLNNASSLVAGRINDGGYGKSVEFTRETTQLASADKIPHDEGHDHDHAEGEDHHHKEAATSVSGKSPTSIGPAFEAKAQKHTIAADLKPEPEPTPAETHGAVVSVKNWIQTHNPFA